MKVKKLTAISFEELLSVFLLAFENYYVKMPTDKEYYKERWKASKVNFNFSYGMFDNEKLVGFILHSIDKRSGELIAYNAGTGVIPDYRGKKIVKSIYQYALVDLKQNNIEKSTLEVITDNKKAINAYKGIGFNTTRRYKCFAGLITLKNIEPFAIEKVDLKNINWNQLSNQEFYSWDNQKESILEGNYTCYKVLNDGIFESFFIIKPENGYVVQFDVLIRKDESWVRLFSAVQSISKKIKINNVDERLTDKINYLNKIGLNNVVDQYEMELIIFSLSNR